MTGHQTPVNTPHLRLLGVLCLATALTGCPTEPSDPDSGAVDTGGTDVGRTDGGSTDGGGTDAEADGGDLVAPIFRNEVTMPDAELAREALRLMGAPEAGGMGSCHDCHGITRESIAHFRDLSDAAFTNCFSDLALATPMAGRDAVACFRIDGRYATERLGVFASGGHLPWFTYAFQRALGTVYETEHARFLARAAMPPASGPEPFTQAEFDIVTEWFLRGTPLVDTILPATMPGVCSPSISSAVTTIIDDSLLTGWSARNEAAGILMHGCAGASTPEACLSTYPLAADRPIGTGWTTVPGSRARILFETDYGTSYWTRASADGRFVAHGGGRSSGASIIDLVRGVAIGVDASYDPGFFPDNSGIMFQGGTVGTGVCQQSVLTTGMPTRITFTEPGCTGSIGVPLYQHMGTSLDGGDHWAVTSSWSGDPGGNGSDPNLFLDPGATIRFHAMRNTGSGFTAAGTTTIATPNEGSAILAPSMRMMATQIADASGAPIGYVLHRLDITASGGGHTIAAPEIARYCFPGGKPAFSMDDRWLVTHHRATDEDAVDLGFTGPSDPGFAPYRGVSNVYLIDLLTGVRTRVTRMAPGQQALFPHFRSDGWMYFMVRVGGGAPEYVVASDAALVLAGG